MFISCEIQRKKLSKAKFQAQGKFVQTLKILFVARSYVQNKFKKQIIIKYFRYLEECPSTIATTYSSANINQPAIVRFYSSLI
jgi:hypothetical protein